MTIHLLFTDKGCVINDRPCPGRPLFVQEERVLWDPTDWGRSLIEAGHPTSTVRTYTQQLLDLLLQMEVDKMSVADINKAYMKGYRSSLENRGAGANYVAGLLGSQLRYFRWLEGEKEGLWLIGPGPGYAIPLAITGRNRSGLVPRIKRGSPVAKMPPDEAIEATKAHLLRVCDNLRERDELIIEWQRVAMLRAMEASNLLLESIPSEERIAKLVASEQTFGVNLLTTKGGAPRVVDVSPFLLQRTRIFIDVDREAILDPIRSRCRRLRLPFVEPSEVFVTRRGLRIDPRTISNTIRSAWKEAKRLGNFDEHDRVYSHGLRHRGITKDLKGRIDAGQPNADRMTMRQSGHRQEASMRPYVHLFGSNSVKPSPAVTRQGG